MRQCKCAAAVSVPGQSETALVQETNMTRMFKFWLGGLVVTGLIALISVAWVDKPTAILVNDHLGLRHFPDQLAYSPGLSIPLAAALVFAAFGLSAILGRSFSRLESASLLCDISVLAAEAIKNQLKYAFGRTWPDSWGPQISSLIRDNVYGFHFFHPGQSFESFPSGHAAVVAAVMSVLWIQFPKLRVVCAICIAAADVGLVLFNLHFVSDVVVGTFVGVSTGMFTVALCAPAAQSNSLTPTFQGIGLGRPNPL
jgi:membrane-associated phospholipid phosphatase